MIYIILMILLSIVLYGMYILAQVHIANLIVNTDNLSDTKVKCLTLIAIRMKKQKTKRTA